VLICPRGFGYPLLNAGYPGSGSSTPSELAPKMD
jgi:hypothetical protein